MENLIAFNRGVPPAESFPKEQIIESARNVIIKEGDQILQYGSSLGYPPLREWIATQFGSQIEQVIIGQGSLQLLDTFIKTSLNPGDHIFIEQPVYDRVLTLFNRAGIKIIGFKLHNGSMDIEEIETALKNGIIPKAFYVIPDFQNPSGAEMQGGFRIRLVELAREFKFILIEDGAYRHLRYHGQDLPRLYDLDPGHVLHMSSFSKMISPGIRVGFMVGKNEIISKLAKYAEETYINASYINQAIIHDFIFRDLMDDHIEFLKRIYSDRLESILSALNSQMNEFGTWIKPDGGFFTGVFLANGKKQPDPRSQKENGLMLMDSRGFFIEGGENFMRLPFCALTPRQINEGITRLVRLL